MEAQATTQAFDDDDSNAGETAHGAEEARLVERARVDREAFGTLYRAHAPAIVGYLRRRTGDDTLAEDLAAETFLKAFVGIRGFRARGIPFRSWLYRIATNLANSAARRRRWRNMIFGTGAREAEQLAAAAPSDALAAIRAEARTQLSALPAADQAILVLRFVEGLSIEEVARVLQCPPGTVQSKTARARERLRRRLERSDLR